MRYDKHPDSPVHECAEGTPENLIAITADSSISNLWFKWRHIPFIPASVVNQSTSALITNKNQMDSDKNLCLYAGFGYMS